jgi:anti-sigma factor RsiW
MINDYHKKIIPYLDGSLSHDERAEFEAYVQTHPDFEAEIRSKEEEITLIKSLIPPVAFSSETAESIENEIKQSAFHLLKEPPKNFFDSFKLKIEEWFSR